MVAVAVTHVAICHSGTGHAAVIPQALSPWQDWVLRDQPEYACPRIALLPGQQRDAVESVRA